MNSPIPFPSLAAPLALFLLLAPLRGNAEPAAPNQDRMPSAPSLPASFGDDFSSYKAGETPGGFATASNVNLSRGGTNNWGITIANGKNVYEASVANAAGNGNGVACSVRAVPYLGGGLTRDFVYSTHLKVVSASSPASYEMGLVAMAGEQPIWVRNYYFAGIDQSGKPFIKSSDEGTSGLKMGAVATLQGGVTAGTEYAFTLAGTWSDGALKLLLTVTDGVHSASASAITASPLAGNGCGYEYKVPGPGSSVTVEAGSFDFKVRMGSWKPVFDDEFDGKTLNTSFWSTGYRWTGVINNELEAMRPENVTVANGVCTIKAEQREAMNANMTNYAPDGKLNYASGCIQTYGKFAQLYGYFEARIKMPSAIGTWPAFWMLPDRGPSYKSLNARVSVSDRADGKAIPMGNEIDVVEYQAVWENPSTNLSSSHSGFIWNYKGGVAGDFVRANDGTAPRFVLRNPASEFHTYGVHWSPGSMVFYLDGKVVFSRASKNVSVVPEYLILNCALTQQNWLGEPLSLEKIAAAMPGEMQIDYVRTWSEVP